MKGTAIYLYIEVNYPAGDTELSDKKEEKESIEKRELLKNNLVVKQ